MTEKELRRLGRRELVEIIAAQKRLELELREQLERVEHQRERISNAGSLADAAVAIHEVFDKAQSAADTYLTTIRAAYGEIDAMKAAAKKECELILEEARENAARLIEETKIQCAQMDNGIADE